MTKPTPKSTPLWQRIVFWLYVTIPLIWGVTATIKKALALLV
jgi:hypothetical protein